MQNKTNNIKEVSLRINLGTRPIFGHGKAKLLEAIEKFGSISAAARNINMSYRRAWLLTDSMNKNFVSPLIESSLGGKGGGGAKLTKEGKKVLKLFRDMELKAQNALVKEKINFSKLISNNPGNIEDENKNE